jgi:hypothetical protein
MNVLGKPVRIMIHNRVGVWGGPATIVRLLAIAIQVTCYRVELISAADCLLHFPWLLHSSGCLKHEIFP